MNEELSSNRLRNGSLLLRGAGSREWAQRARAQLRDARRGASQVVGLAAQWLLGRPALYAIPASIPMLKLGADIVAVRRRSAIRAASR